MPPTKNSSKSLKTTLKSNAGGLVLVLEDAPPWEEGLHRLLRGNPQAVWGKGLLELVLSC